MAKYRVYYTERGWQERVEIYEVEANSKEEAEENYLMGEYVDSWEDGSMEEFGVDEERTELIEE